MRGNDIVAGEIGGTRNWDYRYCWLRDTAFTLLILMQAGHVDEAVEWRKWLIRSIAGSPDQIQTIYGIVERADCGMGGRLAARI